jgi:hypothetical protein
MLVSTFCEISDSNLPCMSEYNILAKAIESRPWFKFQAATLIVSNFIPKVVPSFSLSTVC